MAGPQIIESRRKLRGHYRLIYVLSVRKMTQRGKSHIRVAWCAYIWNLERW